MIFSGVSIASVVGVSLGTYLAALLDWRAAFWVLALLGALSAAVLATTLPALPVTERGYLGGLTVVLRNRGVAAGTVINRAVSGYSMMITARMPPSRCTADGSRHPGGGRDLGRSNRASNRTLARSGFPQCRRW